MSNIPDWAIRRATELSVREAETGHETEPWEFNAFARYIAEHEEPPVDPLDSEVSALLDSWHGNQHPTIYQFVIAALKRGIELGKSQ